MKAFLLAAGHGTRLRPLTDSMPKCLVPIQGVPMLRIWLQLCALHRINEVLINVHSHADAVAAFIEREETPVKVRISNETCLLGSAGTLRANRDWVADEDLFWIFYADVLTSADLTGMLQFHKSRGMVTTLAVAEVPDPTRCGVVTTDAAGIIREFVEKPTKPRSNLAFSGLMISHPAIFDHIPAKCPVDIGFDVLPRLAGAMAAFKIEDFLLDIGTLTNYELAQNHWPGLAANKVITC